MPEQQTSLLTVKEYQSLPETGPRYQLIEGVLLVAPAPNRYHQEIVRNLLYVLLRFLEQDPLGEVFAAPFDVCLDEHNVFQPDLVYVANGRRTILTEQGATGAPTLVVEILSKSTATQDQTVKKHIYARCGVEELWLIDPDGRTIELYRLQLQADRPERVFCTGDHLRSTCFPGLEIEVGTIFRRRFSG